jgi:DNA-binding NarL/FixJ family response regulator
VDATLTLLIVDGHQGVREALLRRLQHAPGIQAVAAVGSIELAVRLAQELAPDTVLYDPKTMEGDAVEAIGRLAAGGRSVIVLTSSLDEGEETALARAGAAAILLKGSGAATVRAALLRVVAGHARAPRGRT